ncbi:MAG: hypothetical protein ACRC1K_16150 [Planctomycetia bacterium]
MIGWDLSTGVEKFRHESALVFESSGLMAGDGAIQWFPSQKRLLVFGRHVFDRELGGPVWSLPDRPERGVEFGSQPIKVVSDGSILAPFKENNCWSIRAYALPLTEIDERTAVLAAERGKKPADKAP